MDLKVDELLASIRKTMDDDIDALSTSMKTQARGTLMRGALREMRVNMGVEQPEDLSAPVPRIRPADEDLPSLRDRIRRKVEQTEMLANAQPVPPSPAQYAQAQRQEPQRPMRNDFSSIMALPEPYTEPYRTPQADHRQSYEDVPLRSTYGHEADDDLRYAVPPQRPQARHDPRYDQPRGLMAPHVEAATAHAFQQLSDTILQRALGDRSLEDMARDMLRGQIKQWIDENLPDLVEAIVREEIERVSRGGR